MGALKGIAPLLVFVLVISSLANAAGGIGKRFTMVIVLYLASTLIAAAIAVVAGFLFPMTIKLSTAEIGADPPDGLMEIFRSILATLGACGTSGVAGGSLLLIPMACSMFGINNDIAMQVVAVGFIISVIQDSCETAVNSSGDVLFTATAEFREWIKAGRKPPM